MITRGEPRVLLPKDEGTKHSDQVIEDARRRRFQKAMSLAKDHLGMTDEERHELAQMIPGVDKDYGGSWKDLNPKQLHDMICMLEGFIWITHLMMLRGPSNDG